jgi:predicted nucleic acid-binding protein
VIFVDTSFWIALRLRRDGHHDAAVALARAHADAPLITTNHVRGETWTFLRRRAGHDSAVHFLDALQRSPRIEVLQVDDDAERDALGWLPRHDEREYSFVDATSFAVMRARRIREALAFDGDFAAAGFVELQT